LTNFSRAFLTDALNAFGGPLKIQQTLDRVAHRAATRARERQGRTMCIVDPARPETWRVCFNSTFRQNPAQHDNAPRIRSLGPSLFIRAVVLDAKTIAKKLAFLTTSCVKRSAQERAHARAEKLARRFEALRRIFANPAPTARRLKRKLLALKHRAFAAAKRIAMQKPPPRQLDPIFHERAEYAAEHAAPAFNSS
jgi:hypothetical protein